MFYKTTRLYFHPWEDKDATELYELAKMDGAIILSEDLKKILYANAQLIPSPSIPTNYQVQPYNACLFR